MQEKENCCYVAKCPMALPYREKKRAIKLGKVDFSRFCVYTENKSKFEWDEECPNYIIKQKE